MAVSYPLPLNIKRINDAGHACISWEIPRECFSDPDFYGTQIEVQKDGSWIMIGIFASFWNYFADPVENRSHCLYRLRLVSLGVYSTHQSKVSEWIEILAPESNVR